MNWIWGIVLTLILVVAGVAVVQNDAHLQVERDNYSQAVAGNMMVLRNEAAEYAQAHPTATGAIDDEDLSLPAWFHRIGDVKNYVSGGQAYVYYEASQDGQASEMLKQSKGDALVGINRGGHLFNPSMGMTTIAIPAAIPDGAVVFVPASLNTASATPPTSPGDCGLAAGTTRSWSVSGYTCSSTLSLATVVAHNALGTFSDSLTANDGSANFLCTNGVLATTAYPGATCAPPPPADCHLGAGFTRTWTVSGNSCSSKLASAVTVADGATRAFLDTETPNDGSASFMCSNGTVSLTAQSGASCTPPLPANCSLAAGTTRSWVVSGTACASKVATAITIPHGATSNFSDNLTTNSGSAGFVCSDGSLSTTANAGASCTPPPANCNVPAGTRRTWTVGGATCAGLHTATTVASGSPLGFSSTNGNDGASGFLCTNGTLSSTPDGTQTCTVPPAACTLPTPSTQTDTGTQTATRTVACGTGKYGTMNQSQPQTRTRTRTAYCPAPTGAYSWNPYSAWSSWSATGAWTTTSSACTACPAAQTNTETRTASQTLGCAAGYYGSITQTQPQKHTQTRTAICPDSNNSYTWNPYGAWTAWAATGSWTTVSNTCTSCPAATSQTQTDWEPRSAACPAGMTGSHTWEELRQQSRTVSYSCPAGTTSLPAPTYGAYGAWSWTGTKRNEVNTCATVLTGVCSARPMVIGCGVFNSGTGTFTGEYDVQDSGAGGVGFDFGEYVLCLIGYEDTIQSNGLPLVASDPQNYILKITNPVPIDDWRSIYSTPVSDSANVQVFAKKADGTMGNRCMGTAKMIFTYLGK